MDGDDGDRVGEMMKMVRTQRTLEDKYDGDNGGEMVPGHARLETVRELESHHQS